MAAPLRQGPWTAADEFPVTGMDAVDKIVTTPTGSGMKPRTPQVIERALVVAAPADAAAWKASK